MRYALGSPLFVQILMGNYESCDDNDIALGTSLTSPAAELHTLTSIPSYRYTVQILPAHLALGAVMAVVLVAVGG